MDEHDEFENRYLPRFEALLSESGVVVEYRRDRAGIDTGLHLFARGEKPTRAGVERPYWRPMASRVWFQLKGTHDTTLSASEVAATDHVAVRVAVDHLKFWYAAPEPVYLVSYLESVDQFIGIDVRELVEQRWRESFYAQMRDRDGDITVHIPTSAIMDANRIASLVNHRSMRIDGPAFRGRPLGHRMDPLRSELAAHDPEVWTALVGALLDAHAFRVLTRERAGDLTILTGIVAHTLIWQSPAFTEYGYSDPDDVPVEARPEMVVGDACIILDAAANRRSFSADEQTALSEVVGAAGDNGLDVLVFMRSRDLSGAGGLWRSTGYRLARLTSETNYHHIGLEALTYLVLITTLVYLEFAPALDWDYANYLG